MIDVRVGGDGEDGCGEEGCGKDGGKELTKEINWLCIYTLVGLIGFINSLSLFEMYILHNVL